MRFSKIPGGDFYKYRFNTFYGKKRSDKKKRRIIKSRSFSAS